MGSLCAACGTLGYVREKSPPGKQQGGTSRMKLCEPCAGTGKIPPPALEEFSWQCQPLVPRQVRAILAGEIIAGDPLLAAEMILSLPFCAGAVGADGLCPDCGRQHGTEVAP